MKSNVIEAIEKEKIIVIVRGVAKDNLLPLCEAMYKGGIRLMELTYDASGSISDEKIAENIGMLAEAFEGKMYIGAGTVIKESQVILTKNAGGSFIISPDTDEKVIRKTNELDLVSIPGAFTPTEIRTAHSFGADFVKVFPVDVFGPSYIETVKAPLSHIKLIAVGKVNDSNMLDYLEAGASGFGIGVSIINKSLIEQGDFEQITNLSKKHIELLNR